MDLLGYLKQEIIPSSDVRNNLNDYFKLKEFSKCKTVTEAMQNIY